MSPRSDATGRFVILLYHGVSDQSHRGIENCSRKHVSAADFDRQMQYLASTGRVSRLSSLIETPPEDRPDGAIAVSFDDGFENNYRVAYPILKKYGVPATFFLATGFIGRERRFWVDQLEYLLNEIAQESVAIDRLDGRWPLRTIGERRAALTEIKGRLKADTALVEPVIADLERGFPGGAAYDYADYKTMTWDQAREMQRSGLCDFGPHTVDHVILSQLSRDAQADQIATSKRTLEEELQTPAPLFSYPEGQSHHYTQETVELLRDAGFANACSARFGLNTAATPDFHYYRNMVDFVAPFDGCLGVLDDHRG